MTYLPSLSLTLSIISRFSGFSSISGFRLQLQKTKNQFKKCWYLRPGPESFWPHRVRISGIFQKRTRTRTDLHRTGCGCGCGCGRNKSDLVRVRVRFRCGQIQCGYGCGCGQKFVNNDDFFHMLEYKRILLDFQYSFFGKQQIQEEFLRNHDRTGCGCGAGVV